MPKAALEDKHVLVVCDNVKNSSTLIVGQAISTTHEVIAYSRHKKTAVPLMAYIRALNEVRIKNVVIAKREVKLTTLLVISGENSIIANSEDNMPSTASLAVHIHSKTANTTTKH